MKVGRAQHYIPCKRAAMTAAPIIGTAHRSMLLSGRRWTRGGGGREIAHCVSFFVDTRKNGVMDKWMAMPCEWPWNRPLHPLLLIRFSNIIRFYLQTRPQLEVATCDMQRVGIGLGVAVQRELTHRFGVDWPQASVRLPALPGLMASVAAHPAIHAVDPGPGSEQ